MKSDQKKEDMVVCYDRLKKSYPVSFDELIWRPSIYGVLLREGKILLSRQWGGYDFPGGGVDINETLEEALQREFFEETGLRVELEVPIFCGTSFYKPGQERYEGQYWNCPLIYYLVRQVGGELSKDNLDEDEQEYADMPEWIDLDRIDSLTFYNSVDSKAVIEAALRVSGKGGS